MEKVLKVYNSFEEADRADDDYYASLSAQERVDILLDMIAAYRESQGETGQRLREFIELLNSRRVDYIIVGGHAVAFHASLATLTFSCGPLARMPSC